MVQNAALEKYVNLTGGAVAQFASRDLPVAIRHSPTPNIVGAFALPGGYVFYYARIAVGYDQREPSWPGTGARNRARFRLGTWRKKFRLQEDFRMATRRSHGKDPQRTSRAQVARQCPG